MWGEVVSEDFALGRSIGLFQGQVQTRWRFQTPWPEGEKRETPHRCLSWSGVPYFGSGALAGMECLTSSGWPRLRQQEAVVSQGFRRLRSRQTIAGKRECMSKEPLQGRVQLQPCRPQSGWAFEFLGNSVAGVSRNRQPCASAILQSATYGGLKLHSAFSIFDGNGGPKPPAFHLTRQLMHTLLRRKP